MAGFGEHTASGGTLGLSLITFHLLMASISLLFYCPREHLITSPGITLQSIYCPEIQ